MKVVVFGATGMVGQGAVLEAVRDPEVTQVLAVVRSPSGVKDPKVKDLIHKDFLNFDPVKKQLTGYDACFYCLGIASSGMTEADYRRVTQDFTLAAAKTLLEVNPSMTFVFISGSGTDSSEKGRVMWARVKGATENALFKMPFKAVYAIRPGAIQPLDGIKSKTKLYAFFYTVLAPVLPLLKAIFPKSITTTRRLGRGMLQLAKTGGPKKILENPDVNALTSE